MNVWKVRHEGSPVASADLTFEQVMQGLVDGRFAPTDEVLGPNAAEWVALEDHPAFAETAAEIEEPQKPLEEETRLDMTAMIDVSLVLLVFFILTTSYIQLQKIIEAAEVEASIKNVGKVKQVDKDEALRTMIFVEVRQVGDRSVVRVEKKEVALEELPSALKRISGADKKYQMVLDHDRKVPHGVIVEVQDAAKTAGLSKVNLLVP